MSEQEPKAKIRPKLPTETQILPMLRDFKVEDEIKEVLSEKLKLRGFHDPKKTVALLGPNLFMALRDIYLEVDAEGDYTSFVAHYQKESLK